MLLSEIDIHWHILGIKRKVCAVGRENQVDLELAVLKQSCTIRIPEDSHISIDSRLLHFSAIDDRPCWTVQGRLQLIEIRKGKVLKTVVIECTRTLSLGFGIAECIIQIFECPEQEESCQQADLVNAHFYGLKYANLQPYLGRAPQAP